MNGWRETLIGDVMTLQRGFDITKRQQRPGPVPVVSSGGISSFHDTAMVEGPGVIIGRKGTLGSAFFVEEAFWPHDTTLWVKDFKGNLPRFVYYFLKGLDVLPMDVGSSNPTLNRNHIHSIMVNWPNVETQAVIAEVVGALDDKIAVNDRIAGTGRELGLSMFRQAVLREGSVFSSIGEVALLVSRGVAPKYAEGPDTLMVLNQRCIRNGFVNTTPSRRTLESKASQQKRLQRNDVLVNSTGVGTLGRVARWTSHAVATVDSHVSIVRFDPAKIDPVCAGYAMLAAEPEFELLGEGSTGQTELKRVQLQEFDIAIPPVSYQGELGKSLEALENRIAQAFIESASLAELRDTLLPRLMSGELQVKDAERIVEDVT